MTWEQLLVVVDQLLEEYGEIPKGMEPPEGLSPDGNLAWVILVTFFLEKGLTYTGGSTTFYSPAEWRERGEAYARNSELVVVYDGSDVRRAMSLDGYAYELNTEMQQRLNLTGSMRTRMFFEESTGWYGGVYRI